MCVNIFGLNKIISLHLAIAPTIILFLRTYWSNSYPSGPAPPPLCPATTPALPSQLRVKLREERRPLGGVLPEASSPLFLHSGNHLLLRYDLPHLDHLRLLLLKKGKNGRKIVVMTLSSSSLLIMYRTLSLKKALPKQ